MSTPAPDSRVPEKPTIDGIEDRWAQVWDSEGTFRFDRTKTREQVYSIATADLWTGDVPRSVQWTTSSS